MDFDDVLNGTQLYYKQPEVNGIFWKKAPTSGNGNFTLYGTNFGTVDLIDFCPLIILMYKKDLKEENKVVTKLNNFHLTSDSEVLVQNITAGMGTNHCITVCIRFES